MKEIKEFFSRYERANATFNVELIGTFYAEYFMFGQPQGVQLVPKTGFLGMLPQRKAYFQQIGLISSKIRSINIREIAPNYAEALVEWVMHFEKNNKNINSLTKATYILYKQKNSYEIVLQIDHQDLKERVQELNLLNPL